MPTPEYRVGNHQPQNIYRGDTYIAVAFNPIDAAAIVRHLNMGLGECTCNSYEPCHGECCGVGMCTCSAAAELGVDEEAPGSPEWVCFPCGYHNVGGICTHCGWIRPEPRDEDAPGSHAGTPQSDQNGSRVGRDTPDAPGGSEAVRRLTEALANLVDPDPCGHYDHHGHCQAHMATVRGNCAHATAKELLAELEGR